ncbi:MAG: glycosyltransferase family 39 protein [Nitrosomonas sp.]|nr:glycosyltransferase family 39 protein [Nitrosomonas sp.]
MTQFSIVVPTLNESENIDLLLTQLLTLNIPPALYEIIFVDDGSDDGTPEKIRAWQKESNIRLIERTEKPDLTASVLAGAAAAQSDVIVVMDADLSHPPDQLNALISPVLNNQYDVVIGSRYITGGDTHNWPLYRRLLSRMGGLLACPLCDVSDATSGFFAFRRQLATKVSDQARGYKVLLEILMANDGNLRTKEVPIHFRDRMHGVSKLSLTHQLAYLQRLMALAGGVVSATTASRFAVVGLLGVVVDALTFQWMINRDAGLALAHFVSFLAAVVFNYTLNTKWAFVQHNAGQLHWRQFSRFLIVGALALLLRGGVLALFVDVWEIPPEFAIFPAIIVAAAINYLGTAFYVFPDEKNVSSPQLRWRVAAIGLILFCVLLRLIYLGVAQLIPDEAYYWQYAQHIDLSYYDHPPLVAWLIWLGTAVLGDNEAGVRIGAFLCNLIAMVFLYALTRNLFNKSTALRALMLFAILPISFGTGFLMTPDAPLIAAWVAALYFLERALIAGQRSAWIGAGIAFGIGLLAKYTLALLGLAALIFVLIDPTARRWLRRPHPYLAALLALVLFSPVLIWNSQHEWASFLFQTTRHIASDSQFSVHFLLIYCILLLTPAGFLAAIWVLFSGDRQQDEPSQYRKHLFIKIFTGIPFLIFFFFSVFDHPKFHWNGPVWLTVLPAIAWMIDTDTPGRFAQWLQKLWQPTIIACLLGYAFTLHYLVLGIPGIPYSLFTQHYFWRETTAVVAQITDTVRQQTGQEPIIVGMSKWSIASSLYFYNHAHRNLDIRSRNLFGDTSAMYDYWFPAQPPTTRPIIQIAMKPLRLDHIREGDNLPLKNMLIEPGEIQRCVVERNTIPLRHVYYRISNGFKGNTAITEVP